MHDINRATKNLHVKTNLVHTLHRMQKVGTLPVEEFKGVLSPDELVAAKNANESINQNKPWYNIPRAKFLEYIHSVRSSCLHIFDFRSWIGYVHSNIPVLISKTLQRLGKRRIGNMRTNTTKTTELLPSFVGGVSSAMEAKHKLNTPLTKFLSIANPHNGASFLIEVQMFSLSDYGF